MLRRFYSFIFLRKAEFFTSTFFTIVAFSLFNLSPFFVKWITEAVQAGDINAGFNLILFFGFLLLISNLADVIGTILFDKNCVHTSNTISHKVLTHIHNLDFAYHTDKSSGKLISLMKRGDDAFFSYYEVLNKQILAIAISFAVMFVAFTQLKVHYLLFVLALTLLSLVVADQLVKINITRRKIFNTADDNLSAARVDNLVNFDTVKYFANEKFEQRRFKDLLSRWRKTLLDYFFTFRYFDLILGNIINFALITILLIALWDLQRGVITFPEFLLITTFALTLFPKLMHLLLQIREIAKKYTDLTVYFSLLDEPISVQDPVHPKQLEAPKGEIIFDNLSFKYHQKSMHVLDTFNLKIKAGESIAFVGYSGAGKTTIAKLLMRMYDPQEGSILIDGVNIRELTKDNLRTIVGIVPQDPLLFNNSIFYNIAYARDGATEKDVIEAAKKAKVDEFTQKLPFKYDTIVGERGIKLSGGQRQRLAVARVLLEKPQIIIFDEATSSLDSHSEQVIQKAFWDMVKDKQNPRTSIIIAHRLSTIMKADKIVVMDKGKIVDIGTHEELIKKKTSIYSQLWSLQKNGFIGDGESEE